MKPKAYRDTVQIKRQATISDGMGGTTNSGAVVSTTYYARVETLTSVRKRQAGIDTPLETIEAEVREECDVTAGDLLRYNNRDFTINAIVPSTMQPITQLITATAR